MKLYKKNLNLVKIQIKWLIQMFYTLKMFLFCKQVNNIA